MLYFDKIGITEGINVNKTSASKEHSICHYWHFLEKCFKLELNICNECHDVFVMHMNLSNIAVLNIHGFYYGCIINRISKSKVVNVL